MSNHGHVRPNPDGSRARCGGPGICIECSLEADADKLSAMGGCNSCNDLEAKLSAAEKERDALKAKLAVARDALENIEGDSDDCCLDHGDYATCCRKESYSMSIAREALKAIGGE